MAQGDYPQPFIEDANGNLIENPNYGVEFDAVHGGLSDASVDVLAVVVTPPAVKSFFGWVGSKVALLGGKLFGKAALTVDRILANPSSIRGLTPSQVQSQLKVPSGWRIESLRRGSQQGNGYILREYTPRGDPTGRMIQWHSGGGHHGSSPYWKVNDGTGPVRVGPQF